MVARELGVLCRLRKFGKRKGKEKDEEVVAEKDAQVVAEEELEEVDLGSGSQEPRPISISEV